jgi:hypothetical protein
MSREEEILRELLWSHHGFGHCLYGDDGELQCQTCCLDFARDPVDRIQKVFFRNDLILAGFHNALQG